MKRELAADRFGWVLQAGEAGPASGIRPSDTVVTRANTESAGRHLGVDAHDRGLCVLRRVREGGAPALTTPARPHCDTEEVGTGAAIGRIPTWLLVAIVPVVAVIAVVVTNVVVGDQQVATTASASAPNTVIIKNFAFSPKPVRLKAGSALTVVNDDGITHTLTADNGAFDTGDLGGGQRGSVTVDRAGTFPYHCTIHTFMHGTADVTP